jgi:hypothetical protein
LLITIILLLSLIENLHQYNLTPALDFYFPTTRFWELLSGCLLYLLKRKDTYSKLKNNIITKKFYLNFIFESKLINKISSIIGFLIICIALIIANDNYNWPGRLCILTIIGTILIINAGPDSIFNKYILSNKFCVYIGKISYPLYLWHWPLYSFLFIIFGDLNLEFLKFKSVLIRILLIIISILLSIITYHFIEKPIRLNINYTKYVLKLLTANIIISIFSIYIIENNGLPGRQHIQKYIEVNNQFLLPEYKDNEGIKYFGNQVCDKLAMCRFSDYNFTKTLAIVGDSHALFAYPAFKEIGNKIGFNTALIGPFIPSDNIWNIRNETYISVILNGLLSKKDIGNVIFIIRGTLYLTGLDNNNIFVNKNPIPYEIFKKSFQDVINNLANTGKNIYILTNNPELPFVPIFYVKNRIFASKTRKEIPIISKSNQIMREKQYNNLLTELENVKIVDILDIFCKNDECIFYNNKGLPLYYDDDHLSASGNEYMINGLFTLKKIDFNNFK